jgi:glyoxylase-like metal-dependent hydrolase (beta-lactamase superfamily II)
MPARSLTTAILISALTSSALAQERTPVKPPIYEAYAVRYATLTGFPVASLVQGAEKARKLDIAMTVWVLKGGGRTILVDSGFYRPKLLEQWKGIADFTRPDKAVERLGVKPEDVTDVIITHTHWDHADGADLFSKAKIWIQKAEYEHYFAKAKPGPDGELDHLTALVKLHADGRVNLVDGDAREIIPGVTVYTGGKHTFESQYVGVKTRGGTMVIASDNVYLYENLDKHVPIAATLDARSNLAAQDRMKQIASDMKLIIPGHDPEVFVRFPKVADGIARLD